MADDGITPAQFDRWLAPLRSQRYPQGRGRLKGVEGRYCCLGLYCEIVTGLELYEGHFLYWTSGAEDTENSCLAPPLKPIDRDVRVKLALLNDGDGDGVGALPFHEMRTGWTSIVTKSSRKETSPTSASRENHTPPLRKVRPSRPHPQVPSIALKKNHRPKPALSPHRGTRRERPPT